MLNKLIELKKVMKLIKNLASMVLGHE